MLSGLGTIQGKLKVKVKEDGSNKDIPGCWVKSTKYATYTDSKGRYSISDEPGIHKIQFIYERNPDEPITIASITVEIKNGEITTPEDKITDPDDPSHPQKVKDALEKIAKQGYYDPISPGFLIGKVREYNNTTQKIPGAKIITNGGYGATYSDAYGQYCLSRPPGTYQLTATHADYQDWPSNPVSVTIYALATETKNINMKPI